VVVIVEAILVLALVLSSIEDLRIREVPDVLSYSLVGIGVLIAVTRSIMQVSIDPILQSVSGVVVAYAFGFVLLKNQVWGGGDLKLLLGVASFIGFYPGGMFDFALYLVLVFAAGSLGGMLWTGVRILRHRHEIQEHVPMMRPAFFFILGASFVLAATSVAVIGWRPSGWYLAGASVLLLFSLYLSYILKHAEQDLVIVDIDPKDLVPGDWLMEDIVTDEITVKARGEGVNPDDIKRLQHSEIETVQVKYGMPFVPSFLAAYVILLLVQSV